MHIGEREGKSSVPVQIRKREGREGKGREGKGRERGRKENGGILDLGQLPYLRQEESQEKDLTGP